MSCCKGKLSIIKYGTMLAPYSGWTSGQENKPVISSWAFTVCIKMGSCWDNFCAWASAVWEPLSQHLTVEIATSLQLSLKQGNLKCWEQHSFRRWHSEVEYKAYNANQNTIPSTSVLSFCNISNILNINSFHLTLASLKHILETQSQLLSFKLHIRYLKVRYYNT